MNLSFKTEKVFAAFCIGADPMLTEMVLYINSDIGRVPVITSSYRRGDSGVHGTRPFRGLDLRQDEDAYNIVKSINARYQYDPTRPSKRCAMIHDVGRGPHIHLQSHPNTVDLWR